MKKTYTTNAQKALKLANMASKQLHHLYVGTEHILLGLIQEGNGVAARVLQEAKVNSDQLIRLIEELIAPGADIVILDRDGYTPSTLRVLDTAAQEAERLGNEEIGTEHILLGIFKDEDCVATRLLNTMGINTHKAYFDILSAMGMSMSEIKEEVPDVVKKKQEQSILAHFSRDLTALARKGRLDPVVGREKEINRTIQILSRRTKNNPCLVGEPGVGKTAIVEGLASMIEAGMVPDTVKGKRLINLDLSGIVAGTKYRGEFEERIKKIIKEVTDAGDIILFIDEIHTIIGAGGAEGAIDASNILKPALARGEIQLIGATTANEYRKYVSKDAALERRFQPVAVEEPTEKEAIDILNGIKSKYEEHHNVEITQEAIEAAVKLSTRYINDRCLPDKAIDIIDEACAKAKLTDVSGYGRIRECEQRLANISNEFENKLVEKDFEEATRLKNEKKSMTDELQKLKKQMEKKAKGARVHIGEEDIAVMVSEWTKIPLKRLAEKETSRLEKMENVLHERVIGQDDAVKAIVKAVKRGRVGLKDPHRPIGSFLFLGPTGVGKTELSKAVAEAMFGDEKSLIRVDMSEYMEKHSVSKIIGSPPGYVGYDEGGQLSEKVRRNPYSVILFDEIEKAHPDVFNILLQVLDDGHITDAQGRKIDFKSTIIIMTSNAGAQAIIEPKLLGFASKEDAKRDYEVMKNGVMEEVKRIFKPEFINRIDEIIVFHSLNMDEMKKIVSLQTKILSDRAKSQMNIELSVTPKLKEYIVTKAFDKKYGARPIKRMVQNMLEDELCEQILQGKVKSGDKVTASLNKDNVCFKVK